MDIDEDAQQLYELKSRKIALAESLLSITNDITPARALLAESLEALHIADDNTKHGEDFLEAQMYKRRSIVVCNMLSLLRECSKAGEIKKRLVEIEIEENKIWRKSTALKSYLV